MRYQPLSNQRDGAGAGETKKAFVNDLGVYMEVFEMEFTAPTDLVTITFFLPGRDGTTLREC